MADEKDDFLVSMMQTAPVEKDESDPAPVADTPEPKGETEPTEPAADPAATPDPVPAAATPAAQPAKTEPEAVPIAAVLDERRKRQAAERELAELRATQAQQPRADFYQDPERYVAETVGQVQQNMQTQMYAALEFAAKRMLPDYDDKFAVVEEYAKTNPAAVRDIFASPNPAIAAYELGQRLLEYREMQNPETYRQKIEAEVRQKIEAEYAQRTQAQQAAAQAETAKVNAIPPDLSTSANAVAKTPARDNSVFTQLFPSN